MSGIKCLFFWKTLYVKKSRMLALAKNIEGGNSHVIFENSHPWFLHSKFQTFHDESFPETVKISIFILKRPFNMENRDVIWWSILFSEGLGFAISPWSCSVLGRPSLLMVQVVFLQLSACQTSCPHKAGLHRANAWLESSSLKWQHDPSLAPNNQEMFPFPPKNNRAMLKNFLQYSV